MLLGGKVFIMFLFFVFFRKGVFSVLDGCWHGDGLSVAQSLRCPVVMPDRRTNQGKTGRDTLIYCNLNEYKLVHYVQKSREHTRCSFMCGSYHSLYLSPHLWDDVSYFSGPSVFPKWRTVRFVVKQCIDVGQGERLLAGRKRCSFGAVLGQETSHDKCQRDWRPK